MKKIKFLVSKAQKAQEYYQVFSITKQIDDEEADIFVVLPGGYGTLDEMFDVIASGTVGEHKKPLICINENGFYNSLLAQIDSMKTECFTPKNENYKPCFVQSIEDCNELIDNLLTKKIKL